MQGAFVVVAQACYLEMEWKVISFGSCRAFFVVICFCFLNTGRYAFYNRQLVIHKSGRGKFLSHT